MTVKLYDVLAPYTMPDGGSAPGKPATVRRVLIKIGDALPWKEAKALLRAYYKAEAIPTTAQSLEAPAAPEGQDVPNG